MSEEMPDPSRSFGHVAGAYDRARPAYPADAVSWLVGSGRRTVLDVGAGTGKLTAMLHEAGHQVIALDPSAEMLRVLADNVPVPHAVAVAERLPVRSASVDVVVCAQSFHWFDADAALAEMARVLRPGGTVSLVWNTYDEGIPWVRRLKRLISPSDNGDATMPLMATPHFGFVEQAEFRFWQTHTSATLTDLARSVSHVSSMPLAQREEVLEQVAALYADYGRGHDGMRLPWVTRCYRAVVRPQEEAPPARHTPDPVRDLAQDPAQDPAGDLGAPGAPTAADPVPPPRRPPGDPGMQLIDFR